MDTDTFKVAMNTLDLAFNQDTNEGRRFVYWGKLKGIQIEVFEEAVDRAIRTERFFPTIAALHGLCDRVREEWLNAERAAAESDTTPRLRGGANLPLCGTCNDLGWVNRPNPAPSQPSTLEKCPHCEQAFKGRDFGRPLKDLDAYAYFADRERRAHPPLPAPPPRASVEDPNPPPSDFAHTDAKGIPETQSERVKRLIDESAKRLRMEATR